MSNLFFNFQRSAKEKGTGGLAACPLFLLVAVILTVFSRQALSEPERFDILIKNGTVYDGVSREGKRLDIGIRGERVAAVGDLTGAAGEKVIDAKGLIVSPGFIDIHTHSDFNPFLNPKSPHKIVQGVTTEVIGNCGMSAAPVFGFHQKEIHNVWLREGVVIPNTLPWHSVREYFQALETQGLMTNLALLVGHGNLRSSVLGFEPRHATPEEIERMKNLLHESLADGAFGLSLGLVYLPGTFAGEEELLALAEEARDSGGILAVHMRSEGKMLIESIREVLTLSEKAKIKLEISHLKAAGVRNWDKIGAAFSLIESARKKGLEVVADAYPYAASAAELGVILPDDLYQSPERLKILKDSTQRGFVKKKVADEFEKNGTSLTRVMIAKTSFPGHQAYEGKAISDMAREQHQDPLDFLLDLLAEENFQVSAFYFSQNPEIVKRVIQKDYVSIGSDNIADFGAKPHPRVYGTFPRILEKFVRKDQSLSLGEAIRKMTSLPANTLGFKERGVLAVGSFADIAIFKLEEIATEASYEEPVHLAQGMKYVLVNGKLVLEEGKETGLLAGQVLRHIKNGSSVTRA